MLLAELTGVAVWISLMAVWDGYRRDWLRPSGFGPALTAATALTAYVAAVRSLSGGLLPPKMLASVWLINFSSIVLARISRQFLLEKLDFKAPLSIVIFGGSDGAKRLYDSCTLDSTHEKNLGNKESKIVTFGSIGSYQRPQVLRRNISLSDAENVQSFIQSGVARYGIFVIPEECDKKTTELVEKTAGTFEYFYVAPEIRGEKVTSAVLVGDNSCLQVRVGRCAAPGEAHCVKRLVDFAGALGLIVLLWPIFLIVAFLIATTSKGPTLYKQLRIGKGNRLFYALKFRTMFLDAEDRLEHYLATDPALRIEWERVHKLKNDPRVTWIGRFLRRFSLDELPQIWNVLLGDMSLIGPRPIVVSEIKRYGQDYDAYEAARPGLTGLWQVSGRNNTTYPERVGYDSYYVRNWSLKLDAQILVRTVRAVISGTGAY